MIFDKLYSYQRDAVDSLKSGSILCGGVGSGKSFTSLCYFLKSCGFDDKIENIDLPKKRKLYIITTARKRDSGEWLKDINLAELYLFDIEYVIDSWNNIHKYSEIKDSFFIFDEQRLVGYGSWVKSFLKISRNNEWILLSATPGDTWMDYIPVFIANGFYRNKTEFLREHVIFNPRTTYPKVEGYLSCDKLVRLRRKILISMDYKRLAEPIYKIINTKYDRESFCKVFYERWNIYEDEPIQQISEAFHLARRVCNEDVSKTKELYKILERHNKVILFYNFDYELFLLREFLDVNNIPFSEWNGHRHEDILKTDRWVYLVQYAAGSEAWNCIETDTVVFYSMHYSYKIMHQAAGRIDRLTSPFSKFYYYILKSDSKLDNGILEALKNKRTFNENRFLESARENRMV